MHTSLRTSHNIRHTHTHTSVHTRTHAVHSHTIAQPFRSTFTPFLYQPPRCRPETHTHTIYTHKHTCTGTNNGTAVSNTMHTFVASAPTLQAGDVLLLLALSSCSRCMHAFKGGSTRLLVSCSHTRVPRACFRRFSLHFKFQVGRITNRGTHSSHTRVPRAASAVFFCISSLLHRLLMQIHARTCIHTHTHTGFRLSGCLQGGIGCLCRTRREPHGC